MSPSTYVGVYPYLSGNDYILLIFPRNSVKFSFFLCLKITQVEILAPKYCIFICSLFIVFSKFGVCHSGM